MNDDVAGSWDVGLSEQKKATYSLVNTVAAFTIFKILLGYGTGISFGQTNREISSVQFHLCLAFSCQWAKEDFFEHI